MSLIVKGLILYARFHDHRIVGIYFKAALNIYIRIVEELYSALVTASYLDSLGNTSTVKYLRSFELCYNKSYQLAE